MIMALEHDPMSFSTCRGTTKTGNPCRVRLNLGPGGLCLQHDPARVEEARAVRAAGGRAAGPAQREARERQRIGAAIQLPIDPPSMPHTLDDIAKVQAWVAYQTYTGGMDARTSEATTKALRNQQLIIEKRDLQADVARLRRELAAVKKGRA
jgi:hypothetical protein